LLGVVFGFQAWRLAVSVFAVILPWFGSAWIVLSHLLLGFAIGVTARISPWWERGLMLGLIFCIPSVPGAWSVQPWYAAPLVAESLAVGLLVAAITDALYPSEGKQFRHPVVAKQPRRFVRRRSGVTPLGAVSRRLAEGKARLDRLEQERKAGRQPGFGKPVEDRIVWSELLDLELQDIDEQLDRIRQESGTPPSQGE
jgi:hypothetical protein